MRRIVSHIVATSIAALIPMTASAVVVTNPPDCIAAFQRLPSGDASTNVLILPAHPTAADTLTICTRDYVYSDEADITRDGTHIVVVVIDNGWSWSPNPQIVLGNSLGRLPAGSYTLDAGIQEVFNPPPSPPRAIASGLQFSIAPAGTGGTGVVATPTLSTLALAALGLLLVGATFVRRRAG